MFVAAGTSAQVALVDALSHPRLSSYRRFFTAASDAEALGLYQWNEEMSGALFRAISLVEIVLRNQFHKALSNRYGVAGTSTSRDWYQHISLKPLSKDRIRDITHLRKHKTFIPRTPTPSPDDVVSKLTLGFWPHVLDAAKDTANVAVPWDQIILDILPGHRQRTSQYWKKQRHQDAFFARLDLCNELRNRIAHHEPIWKQGPLLAEARHRKGSSAPAVVAATPTTPADSVARLQLLYERLVELLGWLSPSVALAFGGSSIDVTCRALLSLKALAHYQACRGLADLDVARLPNKRALTKLLRYAARNRQPLHLKDGRSSLGHFACPIR
jgi:hypothetical protein